VIKLEDEEELEMDIYDEDNASSMLDDDELSAGEEGFMLGYEADFDEE
jgi:hypothetical protein